MGKIDITYLEFKVYGKRTGSNRSLAADLLSELADALGTSTRFFKENCCANARYSFEEKDLTVIKKILDEAKSANGKRFRCRDYIGAGGQYIDCLIRDFIQLFQSNGVPQEVCTEEYFKMNSTTGFIALKWRVGNVNPSLKEDLHYNFFLDDEFDLLTTDDGFSPVDQFVFLNFILEHPTLSVSDLRGIYWMMKSRLFSQSLQSNHEQIKKLQKMSSEERNRFSKDLKQQVLFNLEIDKDSKCQSAIHEWATIEMGGGKLQDNRRRKALAAAAVEAIDAVAQRYFEPAVENDEKIAESPQGGLIFCELKENSEKLLRNACAEYYAWKTHRWNNPPVPNEHSTLLEHEYKARFGVPMFDSKFTK